jgi:hypothetical protein
VENGKRWTEDSHTGHVNTYRDPASNGTYDYGVQVFSNISVVTDFFRHYDIPLIAPGALEGNTSHSANFDTGAIVHVDQDDAAQDQALKAYGAQVAKYPSINAVWDIPRPVPEDFLLPFGDFIAKYNLESFAYLAYSYQQGMGNILAQSSLYMLHYFDSKTVRPLRPRSIHL